MLIPLFVLGLVALGACGDDGNGPDDGAASTSTSGVSGPVAGSVTGKDCVAVAGPLPQGAPEVPVETGAPPEELVVEDLTQGTGAVVEATSTVTVDYIGVACSSGKVFDNSYERGEPPTFPLNGVIPGWQQGLVGMKVGGARLLGIPPELAYRDEGAGSDIAPGETLWFVVEMRDAQAA